MMVRRFLVLPLFALAVIIGQAGAEPIQPVWPMCGDPPAPCTALARAYEEREFEHRAAAAAKYPTEMLNKRLEGLFSRMAFAQRRGDTDEVGALRQQIEQTIRSAPAGARPSPETIRKSLQQALNPSVGALRGAPKAARPGIAATPYVSP